METTNRPRLMLWWAWASDYPDEGAELVEAANAEDAQRAGEAALRASESDPPMGVSVRPVAAEDVERLRGLVARQTPLMRELRDAIAKLPATDGRVIGLVHFLSLLDEALDAA